VLSYVLLLSFSEHVGFDAAYAIVVVGTIGLITGYRGFVSRIRDGSRATGTPFRSEARS
jgi:inner membrane protein involved in colicin E2 resistance